MMGMALVMKHDIVNLSRNISNRMELFNTKGGCALVYQVFKNKSGLRL